jgi:hypothetical protein
MPEPEVTPGETPTNPTQPTEPQTETVTLSKAELDKMQAALKEANKEAATRRKRLEELETAEAKRKEAELSEVEKLQNALKEATQKAAKLERDTLARTIAEKVGLPSALATRLQGDTPEDMEADAKSLLEAMPKPQPTEPAKPKSPGITNPGANGSTQETLAQKRARLLDHNVDPFGGGGVIFTIKE